MESQLAPHPQTFDHLAGSGRSSAPHASKVDARQCIEPGTTSRLALAIGVSLIFAAILVATISGAVIAAVFLLSQYLIARRARALLRGSSLRVSAQQFPHLHACAQSHAQRLSIEELPEIYVVDAAEVNGFAMRLGARNAIVLTDEIVHAGLAQGAWDALSFVLAHELGHIALGHHRWWRSVLRRSHALSRWDEFSADNIACELVGTREAAECGVLMLVSGPKLLALANRKAALAQAAEVVADGASKRAERTLTHPLGLRRLDRVARRSWPAELRRAA
jgi:Zn-dependent protease with chaperone function